MPLEGPIKPALYFQFCFLLSLSWSFTVFKSGSELGTSVMQQPNCVSLLLLLAILLAALCPFAATAHRELLMATNGDKGGDNQAKLVRMEMTATGAEDGVISRKGDERVNRHFRTRKFPSDAKNRFDGHMPFTADYHRIEKHPPRHN